MTWASLALSLAKLLSAFVGFLNNKQLLDAGSAIAIANLQRRQADALRQAIIDRERVESELRANPNSVQSDDGFRRD